MRNADIDFKVAVGSISPTEVSKREGIHIPSLSGSSYTSVQSSRSVHSMYKSLLAKLSDRVKSRGPPWALNLRHQYWYLARKKGSTKKAIWRNSSLGCSHSDAEKVISTLAPWLTRKNSSPHTIGRSNTLYKVGDINIRTSRPLALAYTTRKSNCITGRGSILKKENIDRW